MSNLGTALSGLVNGFVAGREIRHGWDDRKDEKVRQKRADEIRDAAEQRAQESHDALMSARDQALRLGQQAWEDDQAMRDAYARGIEAADQGYVGGSMGATPDAQPAASPGQAQRVPNGAAAQVPAPAEVSRTASGGIIPDMAAAPAPARAPTSPSDAAQTGSLFSAPNTAPILRPDMQGPPVAPQGAQAPQDMAMGSVPTYSFEDWRQMSRTEREAADLPTSELGGQLYFDRFSVGMGAEPPRKAGRTNQQAIEAGEPLTPFQEDMRAVGGALRGVADGAGNTAALWGEQMANTGSDVLDTVNAPFRAASQYFTGEDKIGSAPRVDLNNDGRETSAISPVVDLMRPGYEVQEQEPAKAETKADTEIAAGATKAMNELGQSPDMQAAADGVPADALGAEPGQPLTDAQVRKGAATYMESWRENGAPLIMKELLRQGRVGEAQKLDEWMRSADAQKGMELWAQGTFQAQMGDLTGALETWMDAFNEAGYYDDGYEVVKEKTEIIKDSTGNPIGASVTFKNQETGEENSRIMTPDSMGEMFAMLLSPVEAFKASMERQKALQEALIAKQEADAKTARDLVVEDYKATRSAEDKAAQYLFEQGNGIMAGPEGGMTLDQARQRVLGSTPQLPDEDVPVLRAP
ncbi:MAG: hypothetical protein EP336_09530 [Rhodobacteraceae bacterium]|nr:MAG: hypothetical protein EP336_09530 [Paracoccaceae bacterium]